MSTNITSTSNGAGSNGSKSSAPKYPFGTIPLPDPAVIERLANEFFLVMPKDLADGAAEAPPAPESEEIPVFSFQEAPSMGAPPSMSGSPPASPPGPLTETESKGARMSDERRLEEKDLENVSGGWSGGKSPTPVPPREAPPVNPLPPVRVSPTPGGPKPD